MCSPVINVTFSAMQETKRNFVDALQQLKQEAREAIKTKYDEIFKDWFNKDGVMSFITDRTQDLSNYGFHQVLLTFVPQIFYLLLWNL
jgi:hypothetical protein